MINYLDLQGEWLMKRAVAQEVIRAQIPGSMYSNLLQQGKIEDPYYRDNEFAIRDLCEEDCEFVKHFTVDKELLGKRRIVLRFDGIDTLADIFLNDELCGKAFNMHRTFEYDVKDKLKEGENILKVCIYSPNCYVEEKQKVYELVGIDCTMAGYAHIRKAHYMFGWDWGPQLPDMGIWRGVNLIAFDEGRLDEVYVTQKHSPNKVELNIKVTAKEVDVEGLEAEVTITSPKGQHVVVKTGLVSDEGNIKCVIDHPELWWPNGYGEHPLYEVSTNLIKEESVLDERTFRIGLRTLTISKEKDKWGQAFCFIVNGDKIFSMGANYIPQDNILARNSEQRTRKLLQDCVKSHHNTIRVWGGGYYEEDYFYDLCDELGIIVWQDFMYACAQYNLTTAFKANIIEETKEAVKRLRHHASLGLWCGNNEIEVAWVEWGNYDNEKLKADYLMLFESIIKEICEAYAPQTFYLSSSPSSGGGFVEPNAENKGDVHYWEVWHGNSTFEQYRKHYFRFCSEFGFEAFPAIKSLERIAVKEDMNVFSYIMDHHQKCNQGNGTIFSHLSKNYRYPKDFEMAVYASQLLQADAIRYGVEHWRRNRGRCMGSLYWQLNDCWVGPSWSSIDYYGRWKALHYASKRFYAPVLLSAHEEDYDVTLSVANGTMKDVVGTVKWAVKDNCFNVMSEGIIDVELKRLSAKDVTTIELASYFTTMTEKRNRFLSFEWEQEGVTGSKGSLLFSKSKHFAFKKPEYTLVVKEEQEHFIIHIRTDVYTKYICLEVEEEDCVFSDNYFDITSEAGEHVVVEKNQLSKSYTIDSFKKAVQLKSVYDI